MGKFNFAIALVLVFGCSTFQSKRVLPSGSREELVTELKARLENLPVPKTSIIGGEQLQAAKSVKYFYQQRDHALAWFVDDGLSRDAIALIEAIHLAGDEGLRPSDYHDDLTDLFRQEMEKLAESPKNIKTAVELDILLTDAFLAYGSHLFAGKVNPNAIDEDWLVKRKRPRMTALLEKALEENSVSDTLKRLAPQRPEYDRLKQALAEYRRVGKADKAIAQIEVNLERWRWVPRELGERYLLVNIPAFQIQVFDGGKNVLAMKAVVGKDQAETPIFSDDIEYVVLNPSWHIPTKIAVKEMLPKIKRSRRYLASQNIRVIETVDGEKREVAASAVDWTKVSEENFPYSLRQDPGPKNPLGSIKFMFPNPLAIYLHGTTNPRLFDKTNRAYSHGCIRVEDPVALAAYLLKDNDGWSAEKVLESLKASGEQEIALKQSIPVHLYYWTAFINDKNQLEFRPDIYEWDRRVLAALKK